MKKKGSPKCTESHSKGVIKLSDGRGEMGRGRKERGILEVITILGMEAIGGVLTEHLRTFVEQLQ